MIKHRIFKAKICKTPPKNASSLNYVVLLPVFIILSIASSIFIGSLRGYKREEKPTNIIEKEYAVVYYKDTSSIKDDNRFIYKRFKSLVDANKERDSLNTQYDSLNKVQGTKIGIEEIHYYKLD
jgi:hypothetical protein